MTNDSAGRPGFTCPACRMTSYHPDDVKHEYCGSCHRFTGDPVPPVVVGQCPAPVHWQVLDAYSRAHRLPLRHGTQGPTITAAEVNRAADWWNTWNRGFAFPRIPVDLRELYVQVAAVLTEELREPGHRASLAEAALINRIRRLFEGPDSGR